MNDKFENLEREDVVSVYAGQILLNNRTFVVNELIIALMQIVKEKAGNTWIEDKEHWFREGVDCKILKPGAKNWSRGKVRFTLEFIPENLGITEPDDNANLENKKSDSPLDDIRQKMHKDNQPNNS